MREDWKESTIIDVCDIHDNLRKPINSKERNNRINGKNENELYPYYGATGQVGYIDDYLTDGDYILLGEDAAPFLDYSKDVAYKISGKTWVNNHAHILKSKFYDDYLLHYLNHFNYRNYVSGTTRLKLTQGRLKQIPVIVPPLVEQKSIVKKIEALFSSLNSGITDLKKAQNQLVIYRQAVLKKAFEGELTKEWREKQTNLPSAAKLLNQIKEERRTHYETQVANWKQAVKVWENNQSGKKPSKPTKLKELVEINADEIKAEVSIPENWIYKKIGNITDSIVPNRDKPKSFSGNIHWVTTPDLNLDSIKINYKNIEKGLTKEECLNYNARIIPVNSVIMTCVGMLGTSSIVAKEIVINQQLHAFLPANTYIPEYLAYLIRFNSSYLERSSTATTVKYLNKTKCNSLPFPVCSIQEQHQILREIESRLSVCDKVEESIKESLQKAVPLRQSILKKAFEGKLLNAEEIKKCKQHKDYEPASVLLERIKKEKLKK
jgi:type I restriction enzyme S subunit